MRRHPAKISGFDLFSRFMYGTSLGVSLWLGYIIVGSAGPGFYGGTALLIVLILAAQFAVLVLGVVLPAAMLAFGRRLRMAWPGWVFLALALLVAVAESLVVSAIPVTGNC